jgi:murein DD-endopeptidase MepM/ murein hydrolase activator NlpD
MRTLRLAALLVPLFLGLSLPASNGPEEASPLRVVDGRGAALVVQFRSLRPGDILLLTLEEPFPASEARVRFIDKEYVLRPDPSAGRVLALAGLDLGLKPGTHSLTVTFSYPEGVGETVTRALIVESREFPHQRIQLAERYVTPPVEELERIRRDAERLRAALAEFTPRWLGREGFILPHEGAMRFNFGERRVYNGKRTSVHSGVDISAARGDPVVASNSGRVALAGNLYFSGNTVILDHGLGVFTSYLHMSRLLVHAGDVVDKGAVLGEVGSTGRSTGPHLHWGVSILGNRVDPRALVRLPLVGR